ncbi:hypothetical protein [Aurantiacibacter aquimixticola]|uniref:Uncharacterized protein n=1 Tax=Aurantiacibacter aquimixticola TaxID=1958945 RepID=A0A419RSQ1_9SPHN|nr:hypothetical protein [Aurantiacibacter aquimixticola]RJY08799.1 hypothetical protein D6201_04975 [Aurantiacibacter aquimixticola]
MNPRALTQLYLADPTQILGAENLERPARIARDKDHLFVWRHVEFVRVLASFCPMRFIAIGEIDPRKARPALVGNEHRAFAAMLFHHGASDFGGWCAGANRKYGQSERDR